MSCAFTFSKNERLCDRALISVLFTKGRTFYESPFKVFWADVRDHAAKPVQLLISVPRRNLKKAVVRNLMKRRIREAWRKNKLTFYSHLEKQGKGCNVAIVFLGKQALDYADLEPIIIVILQRLIQENEKIAG